MPTAVRNPPSRRGGRLLAAVAAAAGAWLGGYVGNEAGVAITRSRGQQGLDGIAVETVAALVGVVTILWSVVLVALVLARRNRSLATATVAALLAAVGIAAVALLSWTVDLLWSPASTPGWYDATTAGLFTLAMAVSGFAARRTMDRPRSR